VGAGREWVQVGSGCRSGVGAGRERVQVGSGSVVVRDVLRNSLDPTEGWSEDSTMDRKT